jgi:HAD superfamily hydrolase (TIGR01509 family)
MVEGKKQSKTLHNKQFVFFDLDGTILNSEPLHMLAIQQLLLNNNPPISLDANTLCEQYHGLDDLAVYHDLCFKFPHFNLSEAQFLSIKNKIYIDLLQKTEDQELETLITPGFRRFLKRLYRQKRTIGLVSASEKEVVLATIKRLGIDRFFSVVEYRKPQVASKPSPTPYLNAMQKVGATPHNSLIFEDSNAGLTSALSSQADVYQIHHFTKRTIKVPAVKNFNSRKLL